MLAEKDWRDNIRCIEVCGGGGGNCGHRGLVRILWTKDPELRRGMGVLDSLEG